MSYKSVDFSGVIWAFEVDVLNLRQLFRIELGVNCRVLLIRRSVQVVGNGGSTSIVLRVNLQLLGLERDVM